MDGLAIDWLETASLRALQRQLRRAEYHVFHYIGHGGYDRDADDGVLLLEDEHGRSARITGVQLGTILQDELSLRLAVLNACEGARSSVEDPFSGVATSLIEREIPAVIGMQFEITDRSAIVFASEFYAALADGYPVDSALAEARKAIYADKNDVEWATPVLFMRVQDGLLFEVPDHASARDQKPDPTEAVAAAKAEAKAVKAAAAKAAATATDQKTDASEAAAEEAEKERLRVAAEEAEKERLRVAAEEAEKERLRVAAEEAERKRPSSVRPSRGARGTSSRRGRGGREGTSSRRGRGGREGTSSRRGRGGREGTVRPRRPRGTPSVEAEAAETERLRVAAEGQWMAERQVPNGTAAVGRGFLGGLILVAAYGGLYLLVRNYLPGVSPADAKVLPWLSVAVVTVLLTSIGGLLIEQFVPPLRAPEHDASRWLVVLILGLTLGPLSFLIAYSALGIAASASPDVSRIVAVSVLAFLVAEVLVGRGSARERSGSN